jgi:hypothetical protein
MRRGTRSRCSGSDKWADIKAVATDDNNPMHEVLRDYFNARDALLAALTDEELLLADFMRNRAAHPRPDAYSLKWDGKSGSLRSTGRKIRIRNRSFSADEIHTILRAADGAHGDVNGLTCHMARRILKPVRALVAARAPLSSDDTLKTTILAKFRKRRGRR